MNYNLLSSKQLKLLNDCSHAVLQSGPGLCNAARSALEQLRILVDGHFCVFSCRRVSRETEMGLVYPENFPINTYETPFSEYCHQHPILQHFEKNRVSPVVQLNDLVQKSRWEQTDLYQGFFKPLRIKHLAGVLIPLDAEVQASFANGTNPETPYKATNRIVNYPLFSIGTGRDTRAFTREECSLLDLFTRNISALLRRELRWELAMKGLEQKAAQAGNGAELPYLLAVVERCELTPAQSEVLKWISMGKTNGEIATILGNSIRTVQGHVEVILSKLQVENRVSAAYTVWSGNLNG